MLIATFGSSTGWAGKTITRESEYFILQDHGPITATDVMEYDQQRQLVWANEGTRAWVGSLGGSLPLPVAHPAQADPAPKSTLIATFGPTTAWVGRTITFENHQFIMEGYGPISARATLAYGKQGHLDWATDRTQAWVRSQATDSLTLVWLAAFSPLLVGVFMAANSQAFLIYLAPFVLLMFDRENLKKAGVETKWLILWAFLLVPGYLFVRLRRTNQPLWPFAVWILCFLVSLAMPVAG